MRKPHTEPHGFYNDKVIFNRATSLQTPSPQQEAVLVHLGLYLLREGF